MTNLGLLTDNKPVKVRAELQRRSRPPIPII